MRRAVAGGTAVRLSGLPAPVGAKTGTAQDGGLPPGSYDNWITAAAPFDAPEIVMTALVQGPGTGGNTAKAVVAEGLRHYLAHRSAVVATGRLQATLTVSGVRRPRAAGGCAARGRRRRPHRSGAARRA